MSHRGRTRFIHHRSGQVGLALAFAVTVIAVFGPLLVHHSNVTDYANELARPSRAHWLGTDLAGRDQLARVVAGARTSLEAVLVVFAMTTSIGLLVGGASGHIGGVADAIISRVIDVLLGLPSLIIALAIVGALGVGSGHLVMALVFSGWAYPARIARSLVLAGHSRLDVVAARMAGVGRTRVFLTHVLPGALATVLVAATTTIGEVVLALAGLSFLGLGAQPPTAELGQMLAESQSSLASAPWLITGPGVIIALTVAAAMLISEALRDAIAPRSSGVAGRRDRARLDAAGPSLSPTRDSAAFAFVLTNLHVAYPDGARAVRGITIAIEPAECLALIGESGCGKTTLARAALGLLPPGTAISGELCVGATNVLDLPKRSLRRARGRVIGYVAQDPFAACDPLRTVGHHVNEAWLAHRLRPPAGEATRRVTGLGVANAGGRLSERPHRWSGGMLQRATIASATAHEPTLTIADEPTSALDTELADDVLSTLRAASRAVLLVSHDLRLVARHSDRVAVMYAGRIVEIGPTDEIISRPRHPYTRALLAATPQPDGSPAQALPGTPPSLARDELAGCSFAPRCSEAHDICHQKEPALMDGLSCWVATPSAARAART